MSAGSLQKKDSSIGSLIDLIMKAANISVHPDEKPVDFTLALHLAWKRRAPTLRDGKSVHSDRQLAEWLIEFGDEVRSLTPKLRGRTKLKPEDAGALVDLFLRLWNHAGSETDQRFDKVEREQYQPLLSVDDIEIVRNYIETQVADEQARTATPHQRSVVVRDSNQAIFENFKTARALITISPQSTTFIPRDTKNIFRGFRNQMNTLWTISRSSKRPQMLIWIFPLGNQTFDDDGVSQQRLYDLENLVGRFRALRLFDDKGAKERWDWLCDHSAILLRDIRRVSPPSDFKPTSSLTSDHVLLRGNPDGWLLHSSEYRELFGKGIDPELLNKRNYTIFCGHQDDEETPFSEAEVRYVGHTSYSNARQGDAGLANVVVKGRELPTPGPEYDLAYRTVAAAAAYRLGIDKDKDPEIREAGKLANDELMYHNITVLNLREFMTYPD